MLLACVVAGDRGELLPDLHARFGPPAVMTVLAHELGHAVQFRWAWGRRRRRSSRSRLPVHAVRAAGSRAPARGASRTACLTGFWAATLTAGTALRLSPGDLDEAVAEMLAPDSLIAADARGAALPAGFARVAAFRDGFAAAEPAACAAAYP
ncbi:neutral zinc metallopeptidase [Amycolatopsis albispora]|uniref:neutral zinc metallopeptidase n=1 Tax=Amycolatopsis albispora TaxID=1804986 RepID=UPI001F2A5648|nr:neutral zinc metallopeptidase [Amycolatopsis albispora]